MRQPENTSPRQAPQRLLDRSKFFSLDAPRQHEKKKRGCYYIRASYRMNVAPLRLRMSEHCQREANLFRNVKEAPDDQSSRLRTLKAAKPETRE
jgi:hypothetical protein